MGGGVAVEQNDAKCFMWKWHSLLRMIDKWYSRGASVQLKEEFI